MVARGAHLIIACRSLEVGEAAAADLRACGGEVTVMRLDLASLASVRQFATAFLATDLPLHALLCNAGVMPCPFALTEDGLETMFCVNFLAQSLLVEILLPRLRATSAPAGAPRGRVVFTSSIVHHFGYAGGLKAREEQGILARACFSSRTFSTPPQAHVNDEKDFVAWKAYSQSKLAQVLHARTLAEQFKVNGDNLASFAVHPGAVHTAGSMAATAHSGSAGGCLSAVGQRFVRTAQQGAGSLVFAAAHPALEAARGGFVCNANLADGHASKLSRCEDAQRRLRELRVRLLMAAAPAEQAAAADDAQAALMYEI